MSIPVTSDSTFVDETQGRALSLGIHQNPRCNGSSDFFLNKPDTASNVPATGTAHDHREHILDITSLGISVRKIWSEGIV